MRKTKSENASEKTKRLNLRLTLSEHKEIRREALEQDMSLQDYVLEATRRALHQSKRREPEPVTA